MNENIILIVILGLTIATLLGMIWQVISNNIAIHNKHEQSKKVSNNKSE